MGGRGRSRTQRKHFRQGRENVWKRSKSDSQQEDNNENTNAEKSKTHWEPFATQNAGFDDYYKEQGIVPEEEWDTFIQFLRKPLPAAFRINSSSQFCADIRSQLENDFMHSLQAEDIDGSEVDAIRPLPWYPENLAWHSNFSRMQLRKNQTLEKFHEFLKLENEIGNITRQEAVSMVPPLFLDVRPDHFVLDMCAAPGSKTFQLLEMIHMATVPGTLPTGMVIANDADVQRCNLLIHQTKRMCTANLIVTNHEAQHFPSCHLSKNHTNASENGTAKEPLISELLFDRVLCDVPCSGDGTLRKAPDIWRKWTVGMGNGVHCLQVQIAMRGVALLKVGGRMVYSTCSMNPVENEAVVAEILRRCEGSIELLDVSTELPQLVRRPGLKKWKVRDKGMWLASYKDVPQYRRSGILRSMFPCGKSSVGPSDNDQNPSGEMHDNGDNEISKSGSQLTEETVAPTDAVEEEVSTFPLEHCMRIVPHDQNTGAFFIAVFKKLSNLPAIQNNTNGLRGQSNSSNDDTAERLKSEVKENTNGMDIDLADAKDQQLPEETPDTDLIIDNEVDEDLALDAEPSKISVEIKAPGDTETASKTVRGKRKLQMQGKWKGVDPVVFFRDETVVGGIKSFYGIEESFPFSGNLITRNPDTNHVKRIYYISKSVKDVLQLNVLAGQRLKITSIGLKMFERQTSKEGTSSPCMFRISSEGLPLILPHISKQILCAYPVDFKHLLQYKSIKFADFVNAEFGEKAQKLGLGCCVVVLNKDSQILLDPTQVDASTIAIGCWRGRTNVSVMVTALDCQELLERLLARMDIENVVSKNKTPNVQDDNGKVVSDIAEDEETEAIAPPSVG
ncbi:hypothetical protein LguiB_032725 [Lonicera macranthoides]